MNEVDLFAMGGGLPQGVHQYYANTYNPAYPTPHGYAKGGEVGNRLGDFRKRLIDLGDKEFVDYKEKQLKNKQELYYAFQDRLRRVHKQNIFVPDDLPFEKGGEIDAFIMKFVKDAPASNLRVDSQELTAKLKKGGKLGRSKHSLMQDRRRVSSEPWEVAYQKRKSKMEAGGTLPTPFGQAGLVGETGAMNEVDMFAMGGGLPQGVHQFYANTYNPAYPTPHGYAKGGLTDSKYIPSYEIYEVVTKDGKVYENDYSAMEFLSGAYISDKVVSKSDEDKSQMSLFKKGGKLPKGAIYIKRRDIDYITVGDDIDDAEKVNGKNLFNGFWIDPKKQKTLIAEAKKQGRLGKSKAKVGDKVKLIKGAGSETIFRNFPNGEYEVKKVKKGNKSVPEGFYEIENKDGNKTQLATSRFETKMAKGGKTQGYNDKLDESLGNTKGKRSTKEQNYKDRRNESEAMEKKGGKRKYARVKTMDKGNRKKRQTPMSLAKEIRKEGEKWQDAVKRASAMLKKK